mgnify:CR=1 FL=1
MAYLKYIALVIGIVLVMIVKTEYTKRNGTQTTEPYTKKEQIPLSVLHNVLRLKILKKQKWQICVVTAQK